MKVETVIRHRTEAKILRMSEPLVMSRTSWIERGGIYHGSITEAAKQNYFTAWKCERLKQPITAEELAAAKDFAMFKGCYMENILPDGTRPCIPVFYREVQS